MYAFSLDCSLCTHFFILDKNAIAVVLIHFIMYSTSTLTAFSYIPTYQTLLKISSDRTVYLVLYIQYCLLVTSHFSLANSFCIFLTLFGTVGFVARKLYPKFGTNKLPNVVKHERGTEIN